jgi:hypothetical protein
MTTDTAVRVTRLVVEGRTALADIPFVDHPELQLSKHESTQMPFRYVRGKDGGPVMPEVGMRASPDVCLRTVADVGAYTTGRGEGVWGLDIEVECR